MPQAKVMANLMERRRCDREVGADKIRRTPQTQRHEHVAAPQVTGSRAALRRAVVVVVKTARGIFFFGTTKTVRFRHTTRVRVERVMENVPSVVVEAPATRRVQPRGGTRRASRFR